MGGWRAEIIVSKILQNMPTNDDEKGQKAKYFSHKYLEKKEEVPQGQ